MGAKTLQNVRNSKQAIELISELAEECPSCGSPDIVNDRASEMVKCNECENLFDMSKTTKQSYTVKRLQQEGFEEAAAEISAMSSDEYNEFLTNFIF